MATLVHEDMETLEEESLFIRPSSSPDLLRQQVKSSFPTLQRSNSSMGNWSPHLRDLHILSFGFLFVFLAYSALQNLESSLHKVWALWHGLALWNYYIFDLVIDFLCLDVKEVTHIFQQNQISEAKDG